LGLEEGEDGGRVLQAGHGQDDGFQGKLRH
jgi:hypothetical protein